MNETTEKKQTSPDSYEEAVKEAQDVYDVSGVDLDPDVPPIYKKITPYFISIFGCINSVHYLERIFTPTVIAVLPNQ